jgi:XapX domain-containing protein
MKSLIGLVLAFAIGAFCRYAGIPSPAPPVIEGALLVLAMTVGFIIADKISQRKSTTKHLCGGPTGKPHSQREQD